MKKGRDIFPRRITDEDVRRRVELEDRASGIVPLALRKGPTGPRPTGELEPDVVQRLVDAIGRRNESQRQLERDAAVVRELILEASRAGVGASRLARVAGVSHQRICALRSASPEARARQAERDAVFAAGEAVEVG